MSPLWPLFPGTLLLLALLAAPGGARADSAPAAARSSITESKELLTPDVDERSCGEDDPSPKIAANTTTGEIYGRDDDRVFVYPSYGNDITIFCSSNDASNLTIRDDDHQLQAELLNSTTIQVTLIKPDVGGYVYFCTDSITTCTHTLPVDVKPAMSVTAPGVRQTRDEYGITNYFVNRNESTYNIYCSAQQTPHLTVYYKKHVIRTNSVNSTTLMATVSDHTERGRLYYCDQTRSTLIRESVVVRVDYYPEARDFRNQTFQVNSRSITKLDPIRNLEVVNTSPQGATVAWLQDDDILMSYSYKVEHRLLGTDWRAVNAPTLQCDSRRSGACELQLALPCPDVHYELRVYQRYKEATLDMHWSEPATVFFFTAPSTGGEVDPACGADFREPEPTHSARIVTLHKVRELISDERKETRALKKYISGLKNKLAQVKALMDAQK